MPMWRAHHVGLVIGIGMGLACGSKENRAPTFSADTPPTGGTGGGQSALDASHQELRDANEDDVTVDLEDASRGAEDVVVVADVDAASDVAAEDATGEAGPLCPGVIPATNGDATVPCGLACGVACPQGQPCTSPEDCIDRNCTSSICSAPTCSDEQQNGDETDVDCGGSTCAPCKPGAKCKDDAHCDSRICSKQLGETTGICMPAKCSDGVRNGGETDIDCGGADCPRCQAGSFCAVAGDCLSANCGPPLAVPLRCLCPTGMVMVPRPNARSYCIDENEVTNYRYNYFIQANPQKDQQPSYCRWNDTYVPQGGAWPPTDEALPVTNVDFCDAYAFCKWDGKRLCGKIGGGSNEFADYADRSKSEWFVACSADGQNVYPYGSPDPLQAYRPLTCNGVDRTALLDAGTPIAWPLIDSVHVPIGRCEGGFVGLYDMSGNVWEWEDSCQSGDSGPSDADRCRLRGGSFRSAGSEMACSVDSTKAATLQTTSVSRRYAADDVGFRCCQ